MTGTVDSRLEEREPSRWRKLYSWIEAMVLTLDPDPAEYTYTAIETLKQEIELLENKIIELEQKPELTA